MITCYTLDEFGSSDKQVKITFTDHKGFVYGRYINIPHNEDGSIDDNYFQHIIDSQLIGSENQAKVGVITFIDPNANVGIATT